MCAVARATRSVGVNRHHCGTLGKQGNCQVAMDIALTKSNGSLAVAWRPSLTEDRRVDLERRAKAGVPQVTCFATKTHAGTSRVWGG